MRDRGERRGPDLQGGASPPALTAEVSRSETASGAHGAATGRPARIAQLDGYRGVAVTCVLLFHAGYFLLPSLGGRLLPGGFLGVDIFFVLSGFLMTSILLNEAGSGNGPGRFYLRRAIRVLPALYLLLGAQIVYTAVMGDPLLSDIRAAAPMAVGLGNWNQTLGVGVPFSLAQTWSLGVEEQFYLVWPLVILVAFRFRLRLRDICLAGIATAVVLRLVLLHAHVAPSEIYSQTEARMDQLLIGALAALIWRQGLPLRWIRVLAVPSAAVLAVSLVVARADARWLYEGGFTLIGVAAAVVMLAALGGIKGTGWLGNRHLRAMGRYSYSLYLWHPFVFFAASRAMPHDTWERVLVAAVALAAVSAASTRLLEEPLRRRISRRYALSVVTPS